MTTGGTATTSDETGASPARGAAGAAAPGTGPADLLVTNGVVLTMAPDRHIVHGGAVAVGDGRILAVGATAELRRRYPGTVELDAAGGVVAPGLVNAHQHVTGGPLLWSGIPDNLVPGASIFEWAVPVHAAEGPDDERLGAMLVAAASLRNGVTTLIEPGTVGHAEAVAEGLAATGIRAGVGVWAWDIEEGPFAAPAAEVLARLGAVLDAHPQGGLIEGWVTLIGHSLASDELLAGAAELARSRRARMTMHLSPTRSDPEVYLERFGERPAVHLARLGVLGPHLLIGHGVWLDDAEVEVILDSRTALAYCPWAYLRLGQGVSGNGRHAEIYRRGGRVALGCDATNAGDAPDVLRAAALAAGLAKDQRVDPTWFGAHEALELATVAGAEAVGLGERVGSLEPGKEADLVVFGTEGPLWATPGDPAQKLVWGADGSHVRHVVVAGRLAVSDGRCVLVDEEALAGEARRAATAMLERAGLSMPTRWPVRGVEPPC
jgi:5-methylthioadenosine/S-adenosylhomocysteine deaminase